MQDLLREDAERSYKTYEYLLNEGKLARELARMNLSLNFYTQWYWKTNLHNLLRFITQRSDPHAQYEIRVYAEAMEKTLKLWVPLTHNAFTESSGK